MDDDQQFCLRWNNHQSTLVQNFDTLLESGTLVDCTLAAEGRYLKAHKVVLSACSPYFEGLLSEHYDKHPIFILKDVTFNELKAMMDYMYRGEVNIGQDQLTPLLKAAESLQIRGLSDNRTGESRKADSRPQKTVSQPTAPSLDIPHTSSGLTIEKNRVPRQSMAQGSVGDLPEDTASPQVSKGISSREGSQSPTPRRKKRLRRRSVGDDTTTESQDASNSSDMPQQMGGPSLGIAPVAEERVHADPTDSLGRSALMTQLTKPADEMLQLPLEKPEPSDNLVEPKSEYLEEPEEGVEDLTLDDDMNDLNEMEQDNNRAGPSHDSSQHPAGLGAWHVTGDRSNAGGVVGSVGGAPGTDEVFLAAQEAVQAHRDSQEESWSKRTSKRTRGVPEEGREEGAAGESSGNLVNDKSVMMNTAQTKKRGMISTDVPETRKGKPKPSTSTAGTKTRDCQPSTSSGGMKRRDKSQPSTSTKQTEIISLSDSTDASDNENSWMNSKDVARNQKAQIHKCQFCSDLFEHRGSLVRHMTITCLSNPQSKANINRGTELMKVTVYTYRCKRCNLDFSTEQSLRQHRSQHHGARERARPNARWNVETILSFPTYNCPHCDVSYTKPGNLKRHLLFGCGRDPNFRMMR
ncbi:PREDICTED: modifier of mdg4 isoform X1 [Dinoponera quadriceps]|uniref:Modifier of mdg4 isoform X1 n=1 Tax=Dinoponera quadriceps TaxID=609295 RepID=A0A6P3X9X0_DINQU|nr:PREDICTED: modifier of mdg4 isoform X1 [Dinoponera quadriceps]XP_014475052.1 PREDICTED: modifier of mdg4 isoform X1 [Dinoponera quadriceps]XP_014475053.1 PREDICTED: modifier of mdg4 isoform X1 [Dinoponera quadriceps]